jgi:hypothetical protein
VLFKIDIAKAFDSVGVAIPPRNIAAHWLSSPLVQLDLYVAINGKHHGAA